MGRDACSGPGNRYCGRQCGRARALPAAERVSALSLESAPAENVAAQAVWRSAKARVLVNRGDHRQAEQLARAAVQLVPRAMLNLGAGRCADLAEVLLAAERREAALPVLDEAIDLYERKGNLVAAARARSLLQPVAPIPGH